MCFLNHRQFPTDAEVRAAKLISVANRKTVHPNMAIVSIPRVSARKQLAHFKSLCQMNLLSNSTRWITFRKPPVSFVRL